VSQWPLRCGYIPIGVTSCLLRVVIGSCYLILKDFRPQDIRSRNIAPAAKVTSVRSSHRGVLARGRHKPASHAKSDKFGFSSAVLSQYTALFYIGKTSPCSLRRNWRLDLFNSIFLAGCKFSFDELTQQRLIICLLLLICKRLSCAAFGGFQ